MDRDTDEFKAASMAVQQAIKGRSVALVETELQREEKTLEFWTRDHNGALPSWVTPQTAYSLLKGLAQLKYELRSK